MSESATPRGRVRLLVVWIGFVGLVATAAWLVRGKSAPFVDATSSREMRRIELLCATASNYEQDEWLDERAPPLYFARLVAGIAQRALARPDGDPSLRGVDERELERLAVAATTVACGLFALAVGLLVYVVANGPRRALLAAFVALLAAFAAARHAAAVDASVFGTALACAGLALLLLAARSADLFDRVATALVAGAFLGVGVASAPAAGALVAASASALLALARSAPLDRAERIFVAGTGAFTVAGVLGFLELASLSDLDGLARARLAQGVLGLGVAFLFLQKFGVKRRPSWIFGAGLAPFCVVLLPALAWCAWTFAAWDVGVSIGEWSVWVRGAATLVAAAFLLRFQPVQGATCLALVVAALPSTAAGISEAPWIVAVSLLFACSLAAARELGSGWRTRVQPVLWTAVFLPLLYEWRTPPTAERRAVELVRFLRALRESTPSVGPWNHPSARPSGRVLCTPELGFALAYHAHRAPLAAAHPGERESERACAARTLLEGPSDGLVARLATSGVDAALVGLAARGRRQERALARASGREPPDVFHALLHDLPAGLGVVADEPELARFVRLELAPPPTSASPGR